MTENKQRILFAFDNGTTGWWACIATKPGVPTFVATRPMPSKLTTNYQKAHHVIRRIDVPKVQDIFNGILADRRPHGPADIRIYLERPMTNKGRYYAMVSGMRALEATLIAIESVFSDMYPLTYVDSREWQKGLKLEPKNEEKDLKAAAQRYVHKVWKNRPFLDKHLKADRDCDALAMATYFYERLYGPLPVL